ncbi:MAG: glycosyltransferase family 4 protein [Nitrospinaceae bacterium]|nr:MAG: glycosyltransferase family 4 protein [Nitrospinaceae bacterium]
MRKKVLVLSSTHSTFIRQDEQLLKQYFEIHTFHLEPALSRLHALRNQVKMALWLARNINNCDALFVTFADVHAFIMALFSRTFGKKLFVVVGGFDATWIPEIGYGTYHKKRSRFFTRFTFRTAAHILPVCASLKKFGEEVRGPYHVTQGVLTLYPEIPENKITVVPNGYKTKFFVPSSSPKNSATVLLVASARTPVSYIVKGIDLFIQLARECPHWSFVLAGTRPSSETTLPSNFKALPFLRHEDLLKEFQRAKVLLSLSATEGMANVLSEGMLCECVPVGFPVGGTPEVIADTGILLENRDMETIIAGIEKAFTMDGHKARQRVLDHFPMEKRGQTLAQIIDRIITEPSGHHGTR